MEKNTSNYNGLYLWILAGSAVGILAGFLFAPKSGQELRSDIKERGCKLYEDTEQMISDAQMKAKSIIDDATHKADELKKEAMNQLSEARLKACKAFNCAGGERAPSYTEKSVEEPGAEA